ncbi:alanine--tRNA ligase [Kosmotoga sp.]|uniref:alanine--tRNA ligase n=1 Tax=Kosmotoga sp. TaxID=1955248 RepID=UPI0024AC53FC|nr:alanine--tRNA ligase [Kosmotoga sp.]MDI3523543.1 alanyl-tRNA synthetase [Kosmotoga sp.]MDK2953057.1 alanyl-tRNA synthetase [Kosmotoga sp.]
MRYMTGHEIRESFLKFFESKKHTILPSASLIPNDPQLMFTVAGMVPFKPIFWGKIEPTYPRVATCQKCVRTVDIDNVGRTPRHHTFFEMLGNFSFGDYFKKEAIEWAWEYITEVLKIPEDKLWVSVYHDDDEAYEIWRNNVGISEKRIVRLGKDDNWWGPAGPTGPCGPSSEIFVDTGRTKDCPDVENCSPACDCGRFLEFWNLVFTEYNMDGDGNLTRLKKKNIDTGLGLERMAAIMQGVSSNFETDMFKPIVERIEGLLNVKYGVSNKSDVSIRVIADHSRAITFLITDGVLPSNEGRGYVLRRIMRRAIRHGSLLGSSKPFLYKIPEVVVVTLGDVYPEIKEKLSFVEEITLKEEERFLTTFESGTKRLWQIVEKKNRLDGEDLFLLHDTYGFHLELVEEIVAEKNLPLDKEGFKALMEQQRERARKAAGNVEYEKDSSCYRKAYEIIGGTKFVGYEKLTVKTKIAHILKDEKITEELSKGEKGELIFDITPFYPEKGGQVADRGIIKTAEGFAEVEHVFIPFQDLIVHRVLVKSGKIKSGDLATLIVDKENRRSTARNHTATHLLHAALRKILGEHVKQAGSLVEAERLRFDFSHYTALDKEEIQKIEELVNRKILEAIPVDVAEKSFEEVKNEDVVALFQEKYGDRVRVVSIGDFSKELCGGTHVKNTGEIGLFKIVSESSVSAGVRRIEAITGLKSLEKMTELMNLVEELRAVLEVPQEAFVEKIINLNGKLKDQAKELKRLKEKLLSGEGASSLERKLTLYDAQVLARVVENTSMDVVRNTADVLMQKLGKGVVILFNRMPESGKVVFVVKVSKELQQKYRAGDLARKIAAELGGGGGGRPDFAQAGGKKIERVEWVIKNLEKFFV